MNSVKTYHKAHSETENMSFGISKMEAVYAKRQGRVDEPHRHHYYTVLIIKKAKGLHKIDFNAYNLANHQIIFV